MTKKAINKVAKVEVKNVKTIKERRESNQKAMDRMLKAKTPEKKIKKFFTARYTEKGQTDPDFISKRIEIYKKISKKNK